MIQERMIRAARLEPGLYEEVEHDLKATTEALTVVVIVAIASGIAGALGNLLTGHPNYAVTGLIGGILSLVLGWVVLSLVIYLIGTKVFGGTATPGEVLRTVGYAYTPSVLLLVRFIPILGGLIGLIAAIWTLLAEVIAVRQAMDFDITKTILTVVIGFLAFAVVAAVLAIFGFGAAFLF